MPSKLSKGFEVRFCQAALALALANRRSATVKMSIEAAPVGQIRLLDHVREFVASMLARVDMVRALSTRPGNSSPTTGQFTAPHPFGSLLI
jgi:hypothetical protein